MSISSDIKQFLVVKGGEDQSASKTTEPSRDRFNTYFQYLVSVLGYAAGFGSVWRFPYLVYKNGGGVYLVPYFCMLLLIGVPAFYFETAIGQMLQSGPPQCFAKIHKKWKGLGVFPMLTAFGLSTFYNVILAYSLYFLYQSFTSPLPWMLPDDAVTPWNTDYFYNDVLKLTSGIDEVGSFVWPLVVSYIVSQIIVYFCIAEGVKVSGQIATLTATSPYALLFLLLLRGLFLDGASTGLAYLFAPDWSKLWQLSVWVDAGNQAIFQMSVGGGVLILFGSYRKKSDEILHSAIVIPALTVACGLLAAGVIFCYMGHMSFISGIPINEIPLAGPDLAFIVFPAVLTKMPFSNILSIAFFLTMVFLGLDTQFAFMDGLAGAIEDELDGKDLVILGFKIKSGRQLRACICGSVSMFSLIYCCDSGFYFLELVDTYVVGFNLFFAVFVEAFFFTQTSKWEEIDNQLKIHTSQPTPKFVTFLIKYSIPFFSTCLGFLALIVQFRNSSHFPWWCTCIGWLIMGYPYYIVYRYYKQYEHYTEEKIYAIELGDTAIIV